MAGPHQAEDQVDIIWQLFKYGVWFLYCFPKIYSLNSNESQVELIPMCWHYWTVPHDQRPRVGRAHQLLEYTIEAIRAGQYTLGTLI